MRLIIVCLLTLLLLATVAFANDDGGTDVIEEVVSVGVQPGPKMWRVTKGDHELWIFGTLSPLAKKMAWDSASVEAILADAEEVIFPPGLTVSANPLKGVFALPLLWGIQNSPDKKKLVDLLPPELYARWRVLKAQYIGRDRGIEKHRPIFVAQKLFAEALDHSGLEGGGRVQKKIEKLVERSDLPITKTSINRPLKNPRAQLKKFKKSTIADVDCFSKTVARLEVDIEAMQRRATAWSIGDVQTLRALPHIDQNAACYNAVIDSAIGSEFAESADLVNLEQRLKNNWIQAAEDALQNNKVTFAVLPIEELLKVDGYLAHFSNSGYQIRGG